MDDDLLGKVIAGAAGGLLSSTITASVAYYVGLKQRRLTLALADRKDLEDFVNDAAAYVTDVERLIDITEEIYGQGTVSADEIENLFKLHSVDQTAETPKLIQRMENRVSSTTLQRQRISSDKRRELAIAYKRLLFTTEDGKPEIIELMQSLISDVHRSASLAFISMRDEITRLSARVVELGRGG